MARHCYQAADWNLMTDELYAVETLPSYLYHYTDGAGLIGIASSKEIWATHVGFLNDASEVLNALKIASDVIVAIKPEFPQYSVALDLSVSHFREIPTPPNIFTCSFSTEPDLLSQWRGYGQGMGGSVNIGFYSTDIRERADAMGWRLERCVYVIERQQQLLSIAVRRAISNFESVSRSAGEANLDQDRLQRAFIYPEVLKVAPLIKHSAFEEEQEWRLISPTITATPNSLKFRAGRLNPIPYVAIPLSLGDQRLRIPRVLAGPGSAKQRRMEALGLILLNYEIDSEIIQPSQAPYEP